MYTAFVNGVRYPYRDIDEGDAYNIALQVLYEMREETVSNPELFNKTDGFSEIYKTLIKSVEVTAVCIKEAREDHLN